MSTSLRIFLGGCLLVLLLVGGLVLLRPDLLMSLGLPSSEMRADAPRNGARAVRGQDVATQEGAPQDGQAAGAQDGKAASGGHTTSPQQAPVQESDASPPRPTMVVTVTPPKLELLPVQVMADGDVVAWQEASIASESNSLTLAEVLVDVGDTVKRGQVLARFNGRTVAEDVAQAKASLVEAQANAMEARANARRARRLLRTDSMSKQQADQYFAADRSAQARVRSARAALASRRQNWQNVELRAPDDGVISSRTATEGSVPSAGTELFKLIRQGRLEWQAELGDADLMKVKAGDRAMVHAVGGREVAARVRAVAPSANTKTRTTLVYVDVPAGPGLWAGMFAHGTFELGQSPGLTVPLDAVVSSDGFLHVYRLKPDNHVERVRVTTGRQAADRIEVMPARGEQLSESDRVVVEGAAFLSDADLVRVVSTPATEERSTDGSSANSQSTGNDVGSGSPDMKADDANGRAAPEAAGKAPAKAAADKVSDSAAFGGRVSMRNTVWSAQEAA
ncbi:MAG: efflux RND transporter periplasmic adaptor subunit [Lautropia mirabilis]